MSQETQTSTPWYKKFIAWFKSAAKQLFQLAMEGIVTEAKAFVNDPENQKAAANAVKAAIDKGLRGDDAWSAAKTALETQLKKSGTEAAQNWVDTLLQNSYFVVKNSVNAISEPSAATPDAASTEN